MICPVSHAVHEKRDAKAGCSYLDERPVRSWILGRRIAVNQLETIEMEDILEPSPSSYLVPTNLMSRHKRNVDEEAH